MAPGRKKSESASATAPAAFLGIKNWKVGDLVLAKLKGYPAWPAKVSRPEKHKLSPNPTKVFVEYFGTKQHGFVHHAEVSEFTPEVRAAMELKVKSKTNASSLKEAVKEICATTDKFRVNGDRVRSKTQEGIRLPQGEVTLAANSVESLDEAEAPNGDTTDAAAHDEVETSKHDLFDSLVLEAGSGAEQMNETNTAQEENTGKVEITTVITDDSTTACTIEEENTGVLPQKQESVSHLASDNNIEGSVAVKLAETSDGTEVDVNVVASTEKKKDANEVNENQSNQSNSMAFESRLQGAEAGVKDDNPMEQTSVCSAVIKETTVVEESSMHSAVRYMETTVAEASIRIEASAGSDRAIAPSTASQDDSEASRRGESPSLIPEVRCQEADKPLVGTSVGSVQDTATVQEQTTTVAEKKVLRTFERRKKRQVKKNDVVKPAPAEEEKEAPVSKGKASPPAKNVKDSVSKLTKKNELKQEKKSMKRPKPDSSDERVEAPKRRHKTDQGEKVVGKKGEKHRIRSPDEMLPPSKRHQKASKGDNKAAKESRENGVAASSEKKSKGERKQVQESKVVKETKVMPKGETKPAQETKVTESAKKSAGLVVKATKGIQENISEISTPVSTKFAFEGGTNKVREAYEAAKEMKQRLSRKEETAIASSASMKYLRVAAQAKQQIHSSSRISNPESPLFMRPSPDASHRASSPERHHASGEKHGNHSSRPGSATVKDMEKAIALETFNGMLETLTRARESISKATRFAMEWASKGLAKQVMEVILRKLKNERENKKRVDLLFLVDSMTQYNHHKGNTGPDYAPIVEACLARFLSAVAPPNSSTENTRQCVKVVNLWLERKIMKASVLKKTMADLGMEAGLNTTQRQYQHQHRAVDDPLREMDDMLVDEYGSNTSFQLPGLLARQVEEEDEDVKDMETNDEKSVATTPVLKTGEKHKVFLEDLDGELEMEDASPTADSQVKRENGSCSKSSSSSRHVESRSHIPLPPSPPPSPPPLPESPPPSPPPQPPSSPSLHRSSQQQLR